MNKHDETSKDYPVRVIIGFGETAYQEWANLEGFSESGEYAYVKFTGKTRATAVHWTRIIKPD